MIPNKYERVAMRRWLRIALALALVLCLSLQMAARPVQAGVFVDGEAQPALPETNDLSLKIFLPLIQQEASTSAPEVPALSAEEAFAAQVVDGEAGVVRGVFAEERLALQVVQQPEGNPGYVSTQPGTATQFGLAAQYGVTGLLAHNSSSGESFFGLQEGEQVAIIYGDGARKHYQVEEILQFQALQPYSTSSDFVDLLTGDLLTASKLFKLVYTGGDQVTFQTCIYQDGIPTWGRLFVIATPLDG
jgi:hypothetical protein